MFTIGIDLGGTNIVAGLVDEQYRILTSASDSPVWLSRIRIRSNISR